MMMLPTRYRYWCDHCARVSATVEAETEPAAVQLLVDKGWRVVEGRHICPRCSRAAARAGR